MALLEVMKMKEADLEYLVERHNGALGSTGSSSGPPCDKTTVHCCFAEPSAIQIQQATSDESSSGYKLVVGGEGSSCEFAIGLE